MAGEKAQYQLNREIEAFLEKNGGKASDYTSDAKTFISQYTGYGGLAQFMPQGQSHKGLLYEYYTPDDVIRKMWGLAIKYGFSGGAVLEPAAGIGKFIAHAPANMDIRITAIEPNKHAAKIMRVLYPKARVRQRVFEQEFIKMNESVKGKVTPEYDLVISNPPYGTVKGMSGGKYFNMGEKSHTKAQAYDEYFIFRGLDVLKSGGLLVYIIGQAMRNGGIPFLDQGDSPIKREIMNKGILLDAYRLPDNIFDRTTVVSDIIVFKKK